MGCDQKKLRVRNGMWSEEIESKEWDMADTTLLHAKSYKLWNKCNINRPIDVFFFFLSWLMFTWYHSKSIGALC